MLITTNQLTKILPGSRCIPELETILNEVLPKYEINTVNRIAGFLAQCGHESQNFNTLKENLNYGTLGLLTNFHKYFPTEAIANTYARKAVAIANKIYANRMGNGNEESGDGYKFRGRGAIQLTGHDNYQAFAASIGKTIDETVQYCDTLPGAIESACWFWKTNNINRWLDKNDFDGASDIINIGRKTTIIGDAKGYADRKQKYLVGQKVLTV